MACKPCQKNKRRPLSPSTVRENQERSRGAKQETEEKQQPKSQRASGPARTTRTMSFVLQTTDGRTQAFGSRLEADAARVRAGGGNIRRV